jgi:hypothetical protein
MGRVLLLPDQHHLDGTVHQSVENRTDHGAGIAEDIFNILHLKTLYQCFSSSHTIYSFMKGTPRISVVISL